VAVAAKVAAKAAAAEAAAEAAKVLAMQTAQVGAITLLAAVSIITCLRLSLALPSLSNIHFVFPFLRSLPS
jgi:hypothetical protein